MSNALQALVDSAAFFSAEVQQRFGTLIAGSTFEVDFSASPRLRFAGEHPIEFRPHMIGTSVERRADSSWHWGWDNLNGFPDPVVGLSERVRSYGDSHGISTFTDPELPVVDPGMPLTLTLAAKAITGVWAHYPADAGGGTTAWILVDDRRLAAGEPELKSVVRAIASAITAVEVTDHHVALECYARLRGLRTAALPGGGVRILCADGSADVEFDSQRRITSCQAQQPLADESADQFAAVGPVAGTAAFGTVPEEVAQPNFDEQPTEATGDSVGLRSNDEESTQVPAASPQTGNTPESRKGLFARLFGR